MEKQGLRIVYNRLLQMRSEMTHIVTFVLRLMKEEGMLPPEKTTVTDETQQIKITHPAHFMYVEAFCRKFGFRAGSTVAKYVEKLKVTSIKSLSKVYIDPKEFIKAVLQYGEMSAVGVKKTFYNTVMINSQHNADLKKLIDEIRAETQNSKI